MSLSVDLFWSFRSPYSYLALPRTNALVEAFDVEVQLRPVYPLAVRDATFFQRTPPQFARYALLDSRRIAEREGIAFAMPRPDPIVQDMRTLVVASEQPRIRRLMHLAAAAQQRGRALAFAREVSRLIWDGSVDGWDRGEHLEQAAQRAGLVLTELQAQADADPQAMEALIEANQRDHERSGHWGVPTFVFEGEPFFGQDRIELLVWRLERHGLKRRACAAQADPIAGTARARRRLEHSHEASDELDRHPSADARARRP
jgi:2-hydroxychromene-2-carboxylate isomerase